MKRALHMIKLKAEQDSLSYEEGYKHGKIDALERRSYRVYLGRFKLLYVANLNGKVLCRNRDVDGLKIDTLAEINKMHYTLAIPKMQMDQLTFVGI